MLRSLLASDYALKAAVEFAIRSPQSAMDMIDLSTEVAGIHLKNPVLTASGTFGYGEEFSQMIDLNQLGGFVVKGLSLEQTRRAFVNN